MVASEVDGFSGTTPSSKPTSTHIYCRPGKHNYDKSQINNEFEDYKGHDKNMMSTAEVPSSVVPIDVRRQPLSRMASFRRSLIHVDFLMRRKKKKDKRRNTVTEGDVKELKDALQKIVTDTPQFTSPNSLSTYQQIIADSKTSYNSKVYDDQKDEKHSVEQNNNASNEKSPKDDNYTNTTKQISHDEKRKNVLNSEGLRKELKLNEVQNTTRFLSSGKRKGKSHIPISTVSAAMSVAVEMRECNDTSKESPVLNGAYNSDHNSLDSDKNMQEDKNSIPSCNEVVFQYENRTSYRKRLQDTCRILTNRNGFSERNLMGKDTEVSSSASSENIDPQDAISSTISTESDAFFISSDESEADSSDAVCFKENCGSSTSLGTASDGSLNSLLSETGTEMTSSTGTLTSIGHDQILTSPPPPPPMILSATIKDTGIETKISDLICIENNTKGKGKKYIKTGTILQKQIKHPKSMKSDILDFQRNITENSKNIFTSLVSLKSHSKAKSKIKNKEIEKQKLNKNPHKPAFDMYGPNSPTKTKQIPAFIKENVSPLIKNKEKSDMKSFFTNDKSKNSTQFLNKEDTNKSKSDCISQRNVSSTVDQNSSNLIQTRGMQTVASIPTKYEHQVTVTPVQRYTNVQNKNLYREESLKNKNQENLKYGTLPKPNCVNKESQVCIPRNQRPQPPTTLLQQDGSKLAARVVLDFDGKVIYTTNSLDRKHSIPGHTMNMYNLVKNKVHDPHFKDRQFNNDNCYYSCQENQELQNYQAFPVSTYNTNTAYSQGNTLHSSTLVLTNHTIKETRSENEHCIKFLPYSDSARQLHVGTQMKNPQSSLSENTQTVMPKGADLRPFSYVGDSPNSYLSNSPSNLYPDPNISGLPVQETMLTRHNINLHSKQMEKMNMGTAKVTFNKLSDSFSLSPSSFQTNNIGILNKSPQSTMSTEDLFAVIHDCKKRMNIKTDSDISLASSSRSTSPSNLRQSSSRGTLAETGFLSPRSHAHLETSGDRRSWADFRPVKDSIFPERKSLASDRLGPTKPTSMHDFKMLLLQARTSSHISGPRKSAVEMLKVPLNQSNNVPSLPLNVSPRNSVSILAQNSPTIELPMYNGHSTVPFKRGNRVRTSLQSRYIMYPPIFEDCSEDSENCGDLISDKSATSDLGTVNTDIKNNSD